MMGKGVVVFFPVVRGDCLGNPPPPSGTTSPYPYEIVGLPPAATLAGQRVRYVVFFFALNL